MLGSLGSHPSKLNAVSVVLLRSVNFLFAGPVFGVDKTPNYDSDARMVDTVKGVI